MTSLNGDLACADQDVRTGAQTGTSNLDFSRLSEMARSEPLRALLECRSSLEEFERGYQANRRKFIAVGYGVAFSISKNEEALVDFDNFLVSQKIIKKSNVEGTRERVIYRVFEILFASMSDTSANSAYRYAYGLFRYLENGSSPESVSNIIIERGSEKLYKEAVASSKVDRYIAENLNQKHIDRAMRDGEYAAKLLARTGEYVQGPVHTQNGSEVRTDNPIEEEKVEYDPALDDESENEITRPSWRSVTVPKLFDRMVELAALLNAEIVESKAVLENDGEGNEDDLLRDEDDDGGWKTAEVQNSYDLLMRRAAQTSAEVVKLKGLLQAALLPSLNRS